MLIGSDVGMKRWLPRMTVLGLVASVAVGSLLGSGGYTFYYGQGLSYLSDAPATCANCHVMNDYYDAWQKSGHHHVATCNDCHVPHDLVAKYLNKADACYRHSKAFTLQNFHEPIQMIARSERVLRANCVACHEDLVSQQTAAAASFNEPMDCLQCHRDVGHGPTR